MAAGFIQDVISKEELAGHLLRNLGFADGNPAPIHYKILEFGLRNFLTPNYDTLLEKAIKNGGDALDVDVITNNDLAGLSSIQRADRKNFIYKFHGCVNQPSSIILSEADYNTLMHGNEHVKTALGTLFRSRSIVLIGAGLDDRDTKHLFSQIHAVFGGHVDNIHAICANFTDRDCKYYKEHKGINVISYEAEDNNHDDLLPLLDELLAGLSVKLKEDKAAIAKDVEDIFERGRNFNWEDRLNLLIEEDDDLRKKILSICHWLGPQKILSLLSDLKKLAPGVEEQVAVLNIERLEQDNILRRVGDRVFPIDENMVKSAGEARIDDLDILLGGNGDE